MKRIVLLGASNLTLAFPMLVHSLRRSWSEPVEVAAALGHGRSYGMWSRVLIRGLPGITQSDLWSHLQAAPQSDARPMALITDVGNDLLYGASVAQIGDWVEECLRQLAALEAETVVTLLPMHSVRRLSRWRFVMTRTLFFPGSGLGWPEVFDRAAELDARLLQLAETFGCKTIEPPGDWFGFDPIHIRPRHRQAAWQSIFSAWREFAEQGRIVSAPPLWKFRAWSLPPFERTWCGIRQRRRQPALRSDNLTVSLF